MRTAAEAIAIAEAMYSEQGALEGGHGGVPYPYCYIYGAKAAAGWDPTTKSPSDQNFIRTRADVERYFAAEPAYFARYSAAEKEQIIKNSIGRWAFDCSGFVGTCTGDHQYSAGQIANAHSVKTTPDGFASNPYGSILFTTYGGRGRHIGIDADHGWCEDMAYESTDANVRSGKAGIRKYRINQDTYNRKWTAWEKSGLSNVLQY